MNFNYSKLKGKIREVFNTQNNFAEALGMSANTLSLKLNNQLEFSSEEIIKAVELLNIDTPVTAWQLFFTREVENNSTSEG